MDAVHQMLMSRLHCNPHTRDEDAKMIEKVRNTVLEHFNTTSEEYSVVFTSGATAAIKLVGDCFPWHHGNGSGGSLRIHEDCHTSILGLRQLAINR